MVDPDFVQGNEQSGWRPALVVSDDRMNHGPGGLSLVVPITSTMRRLASHVVLTPPEGGLTRESDLMCEQLRALSLARFRRRLGRIEPANMNLVEDVLVRLLGLGPR